MDKLSQTIKEKQGERSLAAIAAECEVHERFMRELVEGNLNHAIFNVCKWLGVNPDAFLPEYSDKELKLIRRYRSSRELLQRRWVSDELCDLVFELSEALDGKYEKGHEENVLDIIWLFQHCEPLHERETCSREWWLLSIAHQYYVDKCPLPDVLATIAEAQHCVPDDPVFPRIARKLQASSESRQ